MALFLGALPAAGYGLIKRQLRAETIARIENTIKMRTDPLLDSRIAGEGQAASAEMLKQDGKNDK